MALNTADVTNRHPDYALLAGRLMVASLHRRTPKSFSRFVLTTHEGTHDICFSDSGPIDTPDPSDHPHVFHADFVSAVENNADAIDSLIRHSRDFEMT